MAPRRKSMRNMRKSKKPKVSKANRKTRKVRTMKNMRKIAFKKFDSQNCKIGKYVDSCSIPFDFWYF